MACCGICGLDERGLDYGKWEHAECLMAICQMRADTEARMRRDNGLMEFPETKYLSLRELERFASMFRHHIDRLEEWLLWARSEINRRNGAE